MTFSYAWTLNVVVVVFESETAIISTVANLCEVH